MKIIAAFFVPAALLAAGCAKPCTYADPDGASGPLLIKAPQGDLALVGGTVACETSRGPAKHSILWLSSLDPGEEVKINKLDARGDAVLVYDSTKTRVTPRWQDAKNAVFTYQGAKPDLRHPTYRNVALSLQAEEAAPQ